MPSSPGNNGNTTQGGASANNNAEGSGSPTVPRQSRLIDGGNRKISLMPTGVFGSTAGNNFENDSMDDEEEERLRRAAMFKPKIT